MADIVYTYRNKVYFNLTNRCTCRCIFCIRDGHETVGEATGMWHDHNPTWEEIKTELDAFDFTPYPEATFCGYGEPTCSYDNLIRTAKYMKEIYPNIKLRLNTNGLGELYNKKPIAEEMSKYIDTVSISLNAPNGKRYQEVTNPCFADSFDDMLAFAKKAGDLFESTVFTVVDVISAEEIEASQKLADEMNIPLRVRPWE